MNPQDYQKIERWIEQITSEVILSEPDTDRSQFPLRDLINSVLEKAGQYPGYVALRECASDALKLIEDLLFGNKAYTQESLDCLGELAGKMQSFLENPDQRYERPAVLAKLLGGEEEGEAEEAGGEEVVTEAVGGEGERNSQVAVIEKLENKAPAGGFEESFELGNTDVDLLKDFLVEANEHLDNIEQGVLQLEENPQDADTIASIFRAFHTIKGGSGFLNILPVNKLAHQLENLLDLIRDNKLEVTRDVIEVILEGADTFRTCFQEIQEQITGKRAAGPIVVEGRELLARVEGLMRGGGGEVEEAPRVVAAGEKKEAAVAVRGDGEVGGKKAGARAGGAVAGMIKVDTVKFDSLMDLVGELVIAQSLVAQDPAIRSIESRNLLRNLSQLGRITNELQKTAMSLRMVPIRNLFQKMNRVARDTAAARGKIVNLVLQGEDTEMDRTIVEELGDPLLHMVRNSVDHGIELPEVREAAGKPRAGMLRLAASHVGGNILVEIEDDGAGIRTDKVLAKAIERGLVPPGAHLTEKEIYDLIFMPGFSTAEQVTDLSGRGVGMDVVKKNISKLRGKIDIESSPGKGTSFKIYLPLTLAIIDGLLIVVGDQRYILPTLSVRESFRPTPGMISTVHGKGEMVNVRGKLIPLLRLYELFGVEPRSKDPCQSMVVVVESAHEERCVLIDELLGQQEVVIKSLGDTFKNNRLLSGAAILGDGRVGLILDPRALVQVRETLASAA